MDKLLNKSDFIWKEKYSNNIQSNPLDYWYATYNNGDSSRKYYIVPQYPLYEGKYTRLGDNPELYVYFESRGKKLQHNEVDDQYSTINDGYKYDYNGTFKRAFKTLEEAKDYAYNDYYMVFGYAMSFIK